MGRSAPALSTTEAALLERVFLLDVAVGAVDDLAAQATRSWLRDFTAWHGRIGACAAPVRAVTQVIHGDFQDTNVLFLEDQVAAVIDWDKAEARMAVEEILRAMHLSFGLKPNLCEAFVTGYRSRCPLSIDELDVGAQMYGFERDRSTWILEELHLRGNQRVRSTVEAMTNFVPFHEQWAAVRTALVERTVGTRAPVAMRI